MSAAGATLGEASPSYQRATLRAGWFGGPWLSAPALVFLLVFFLFPLGSILVEAVHDSRFSAAFPQTVRALREGPNIGVPDRATFEVVAAELAKARAEKSISNVDRRIDQENVGLQGLFLATARMLSSLQPGADMRQSMIAMDPRWGDAGTWQVLRRMSSDLTPTYLLAALDRARDTSGSIVSRAADQSIYLPILGKSIVISLVVTLLTLVLGAPVAFLLANATPGWRNVMFILVQIPFWTSILVRLAAWTVLLQSEGPVNEALMALGLIHEPIAMMYNRFAVYVAMTHVQLPLMILPIYSVIQAIKTNYIRAALSLGASPLRAFVTVYLPLAAPGIGAGCVLVFISSLGYYITPAIVGGAGDQMISYFIQFHLDKLNGGLAAALASILVVSTGLVLLAGRLMARFNAVSR